MNPVSIITKNHLVTRDIDLLSRMAAENAAGVFISITSLDDDLISVLEPRTSRPKFRLEAVKKLSEAGVPVGVMLAPMIPGLTDHEIPSILKEAAVAGALFAGFVPLRLPLTVRPIFMEWLRVHRPERARRVESLIRDIRGGKLNDPEFGSRMRGTGPYAENMRSMFHLYARKYGLNREERDLSTAAFRRPGDQLEMF
jgi:DNA repair photolyase